MSVTRILLCVALATAACTRIAAPSAAPAAAESLQQLYMAERYGELVLQATSIIDAEPEQGERVAEARFFRALAWLAQDPLDKQDRALLELRSLEFEHGDSIWGRMAALHVAMATRVDALQATLVELGFEQRELQARIEVLEQSLVDLQAELETRDAKLVALERERDEIAEQLEQTRAEAATTTARLRALEDELAALKQIDMQREP